MLLAMFTLKDSISRFNSIKKTLEKQQQKQKDDFNLTNTVNNIKDCYIDFKNALEELKNLQSSRFRDKSVINSAYAVLSVLKMSISNAKTSEEYVSAISIITELFKEVPDEFFERPNLYDFGNFGTYNNEDWYLTEKAASLICKAIEAPSERNLNLLNVITHGGEDIYQIKSSYYSEHDIDNINVYGIDCNQVIEKRYKENFTRLIYGPLKGSFINHDVFDIVFTIPQIEYNKIYSNLIPKRERDFIQKSIQYLRFGGTFILGLPIFRYYKDICILLAKNFTNVQLFRTTIDWNSCTNDICYFVGTRKSNNKEVDSSVYEYLRHIYDNIEDITNIENLQKITFPKGILDIKQFRGSIIDDEELNEFYRQSNSTSKFWKEQSIDDLNQEKHPLLPFNVGQIGLVLTSGFLDGVVDEGNGFYHAVKGRVVRKIDSDNEIRAESNSIEVNETTTNRVEINAFLPDGTYKKLA